MENREYLLELMTKFHTLTEPRMGKEPNCNYTLDCVLKLINALATKVTEDLSHE
jgi:hypothetical protein